MVSGLYADGRELDRDGGDINERMRAQLVSLRPGTPHQVRKIVDVSSIAAVEEEGYTRVMLGENIEDLCCVDERAVVEG